MEQGALFTHSFAAHAKSRIGLRAEARQGNLRPAEMAHAIGGMVNTTKGAFDLLQLDIGALSHQLVERKVAFTRRDVEDIGGQSGFRCRWSLAGRLTQELALIFEQLSANGSKCLVA